MDGFAAVDFGFAREVLQRGIAALYLVAFVSSLNQFRPLLGEHGLLPAPKLLEWAASSSARGRMLHPTLFRIMRYTDRRLAVLCWAGIVIALLFVVGIPQLAPPWVPMAGFLALWFGYMSICSIGQTFYGFGWRCCCSRPASSRPSSVRTISHRRPSCSCCCGGCYSGWSSARA